MSRLARSLPHLSCYHRSVKDPDKALDEAGQPLYAYKLSLDLLEMLILGEPSCGAGRRVHFNAALLFLNKTWSFLSSSAYSKGLLGTF